MAQQTNLNISPYFDDFSPENDYYKVLFKPGYPVQARELTTLQSILQNQVEKFGQHFFKEGAKVIPGNISYTQLYYCVQLNNTFQGVPVSAYAEQLIGTKITGVTSGVSAVVDSILLPQSSQRGNLTFYLKYISSNSSDNTTQEFLDNEELFCDQIINSTLLGNTSIPAGSSFASTIPSRASATGSAFQIQRGVYFIRGYFVDVSSETLILDQYTNTPSYRVGLLIREDLINSNLDDALNDNSQGFTNYSAPGADRLRISVSLFKKSLSDFNDDNFVELATIDEGVLRAKSSESSGSIFNQGIRDTLAQRTFDESGHYLVKPFDVSFVNSLNDNLGNGGIFQLGEFTYSGSPVSDDLGIYKISSGKAYVNGYDIETTSPVLLDCTKPRTTKTELNQTISYNTGSKFKVNRVLRTPTIGIGNTYIISLRDQRGGSDQNTAPGKEIGLARLYDFRLESGNYSASNSNINQWGVSLYDVRPFTTLTLNQEHTLIVPTFVKGANSGATAFLRYPVSAGVAVTVYETNGSFIENEALIFDGIEDGRIAIAVTENSISDAKSLFATNDGVIGINTFAADIIQSPSFNVGVAKITGHSGGVSTVTSVNPKFISNSKVGKLVRFSDLDTSSDPTFALISGVGTTSITLSNVESVAGVANGSLNTTNILVSDLDILTTITNKSSDDTLYTKFPKKNIATVDLSDAEVSIRKSFSVNISASGTIDVIIPAGDNQTFLPFTAARYSLIRSDGTTENLTEDKISFNGSSTTINKISGLSEGSVDTGATLIATLKKSSLSTKRKLKNKVNFTIVDKSVLEGSGIGTTTLNNGLIYGNYPFGTRVEDEIISINQPDIIQLHGVFESSGTDDPIAPKITFSTINSVSSATDEVILGEIIVGQTSGAIAICVEKPSSLSISYILKNGVGFVEGETILFEESAISGVVAQLSELDFNVSSNYTFSNGQQKTFYNHGTIKRRPTSKSPSKKIKIYYSSGYFSTTDTGDFTTVGSYNDFNYATEVQSINGILNSDIIDIRPRVSQYSVSESSRSPLEFLGRSFDGDGNSATNILASQENTTLDYSHFIGRIDRIFLTKEGKFQVIFGTPAEKPEPPSSIDGAIELATVTLPPYLFNTSQASFKLFDYKRYKMSDIKSLEDRIRNLEYYTALTTLESSTQNLFIADSNGSNRFKSGFFVDNFSSFKTQETKFDIKNSIDRKYNELRPKHHTDSIDLAFGPIIGLSPDTDFEFNLIDGENIRKTNDIITLDYSQVEWLKQPFATRSESVSPFSINYWQGSIKLTPSSDTWLDTVRVQSRFIETEGNYAVTIDFYERTTELDSQSGYVPLLWNSWTTNWTGNPSLGDSGNRSDIDKISESSGNSEQGTGQWVNRSETTVTQEELQEIFNIESGSQGASRTIVHEEYESLTVGDRVISRDLVSFMRPRNIEFEGSKLKPGTRFYPFFDGTNVSRYCTPKLIQIEMNSGVFRVGEKITNISNKRGSVVSKFNARLAAVNHKDGEYNVPSKVYTINPYTGQSIATQYDSVSILLNIDTYSLTRDPQGRYYGYIEVGTVLIGEESGATATVSDIKLVTDETGYVAGSFYIPESASSYHPKFETGNKVFSLSSDENNSKELTVANAEETYYSSGYIQTQESVRNNHVVDKREFGENSVDRSANTEIVGTHIIGRTSQDNIIAWYDPLAQSFSVDDETGIFLTECFVYFRSKDDIDLPISLSIRTMENGLPTSKVLPMSEVILNPDEIDVSDDGDIATGFEFKCPIYLEGRKNYAICLSTNSTKYSVFTSRLGENDIVEGNLISSQPYSGNLFKSQNASSWEASPTENLKFNLFRARFDETGIVNTYNPELSISNRQIPRLTPNSIEMSSRRIRVGLGTTANDAEYEFGNTFFQSGTNASGNLVGAGGSVIGNLTITNAGIGYTPNSSSFTFSDVNLVTVTGTGRNARANININNGSASSATISEGGSGYRIGDVLSVGVIGNSSSGQNMKLTVTGVGHTNELIFDNIQGEFVVGSGKSLSYQPSVGSGSTFLKTEYYQQTSFTATAEQNQSFPLSYIPGNISSVTVIEPDDETVLTLSEFTATDGSTVVLDNAVGIGTTVTVVESGIRAGNVQINSIVEESDGLHFKVYHQNHGMYSTDNRVELFDIESDIPPTRLITEYSVSSTSSLAVEDNSNFKTFENVTVSSTNSGFLKIGEEILEYKETSGSTVIGNITRGLNKATYPVGTPVYKYELNNINLSRINKIHSFEDVTISDPIDFDSYHVKLNTSEKFNDDNFDRSSDVSLPKLYIKDNKSCGGYNIKASQNMPFEVITPMVQFKNISGTNVSASLRTTTSTSMSGNEISYIDVGFQPISINRPNFLDSPRAIFSKVNEDNSLSNTFGNKSLELRLFLSSSDNRISPVIDAQRINTILTSNRINEIITNYATDSRANQIANDPSAFQYISKEISMETPGTGLKLILNAYLNSYSDIRAFYCIDESSSLPTFTPFPGYLNIDDAGDIISIQNNDGSPDSQVQKSNVLEFESKDLEFKEYAFSIDQLPAFRNYRIKLVVTSTSQVYVPRIKDLRCIAIA